MKIKLLSIAACIVLATACNSGSSTGGADTTSMMSTDTSMNMMHDTSGMSSMSMSDTSMNMSHMQMCVVMKNNKMMVMDSGKTMPMKDMMTMDNGTKVMTNGSYTTTDGKKDKLKNGQCIMKDGSMTTMDKMPM